MRKKKIPDWTVLKYDVQPPELRCERCGGTRRLYIPATIIDVIKQAEAFADSHAVCVIPKQGGRK